MYAGVVLNEKSYDLDKLFSYEIPKNMESKAAPGKRVLVPFGYKVRDGIIAEIFSEKPDIGRIKAIADILDDEPVVDETGFKIARFVRERYLTTFYEALKLVMPSGMRAVLSEHLFIREDREYDKESVKGRIMDALRKYGTVDSALLPELTGIKSGLKKAVTELKEDGVIGAEFEAKSTVSEKTVKIVSITDSASAKTYIESNPGKRAQLRILKMLLNNKSLAMSDLNAITNTTAKTVTTLQKYGLVEIDETEIIRNPYLDNAYPKDEKKIPTEEQSLAIDLILNSKEKKFLLHGVTGSGKTEIYMQVIEKLIESGKNAIVLVPEIALTAQMVDRFYRRFENGVAVLHSGMTINERYDQYRLIRKGEINVVVGARSAIFAPVKNVGIIIVDEEHEQSYKSDNSPKYDALEIARFRAETENAKLVLASATPSIVSYYKALNGEYKLITLKTRTNDKTLPSVEVVDMRRELQNGNFSPLSSRLKEEIVKNISLGQQSILFLNRRGYSTFVSCRSCGYVEKCPECDVSLKYHSYENKLVCHYCGYEKEYTTKCPACGSKYLKHFGTGTQKVEEEIKKEIPAVSIIRMDADTTYKKFSHDKILREFEQNKTDLLLGTQMVAKGLDFENVTLAAVLAADGGLFLDDYRSTERTFAQITQVCGRAGRGEKKGRAIVQTYNPGHYVINFAKEHNYIGFYETEIIFRKQMNFPPFCDLVNITVSGRADGEVRKAAEFIYSILNSEKERQNIDDENLKIFGPSYAPIAKIKGKIRFRITLKLKTDKVLNDILKDAYKKFYEKYKGGELIMSIDINPVSML